MKLFSSSKKAQVLSVDVIIALLGFIGIVVFLIWGWQVTGEKIHYFDESQDLYSLGYFVSESLIKSEGKPINWHLDATPSRSSISSIGLKNGSYVSYAKIQSMATNNATYYSEFKEILGVLGPDYDLQIVYYFDNGSAFVKDDSVTFGQTLESAVKTTISRMFVLDNSSHTIGRMHVIISGGAS